MASEPRLTEAQVRRFLLYSASRVNGPSPEQAHDLLQDWLAQRAEIERLTQTVADLKIAKANVIEWATETDACFAGLAKSQAEIERLTERVRELELSCSALRGELEDDECPDCEGTGECSCCEMGRCQHCGTRARLGLPA